MALIPIYNVVADMYYVDPDWVDNDNGPIIEGQWVMLTTITNATGTGMPIEDLYDSFFAVYATVATGAQDTRTIGVAGDTESNTTAGSAYANGTYVAGALGAVINSSGARRQLQPRVSDMYNETAASGKITVYHSGGKFATDQLEAGFTTADTAALVGHELYVGATGKLQSTDAGNGQIVATLVGPLNAYPSGVPGTDTLDGSMSLGDFLVFKMEI